MALDLLNRNFNSGVQRNASNLQKFRAEITIVNRQNKRSLLMVFDKPFLSHTICELWVTHPREICTTFERRVTSSIAIHKFEECRVSIVHSLTDKVVMYIVISREDSEKYAGMEQSRINVCMDYSFYNNEGRTGNIELFFQVIDALKTAFLNDSTKQCNTKIIQISSLGDCVTNLQNASGTMLRVMKLLSANSADMNYKKCLHMFHEDLLFAPHVRELKFPYAFKNFFSYNVKVPKLIGPTYRLHEAIYSGNFNMVKSILEQGGLITSVIPSNEWTPLHLGVLVKNVQILKLLLKYDSIVRSRTDNEKISKYLLGRNYVDAQDVIGMTPLMMAVEKMKYRTVKALLEAKADMMKLKNKEEQSALQIAFKEDNFEPTIGSLFFCRVCYQVSTAEQVAEILLTAGCQLYMACCFKSVRLIKLMFNPVLPVASTDPRSKDSALHLAVYYENIPTVKLLLQHGADVNALNRLGETPVNQIYRLNEKNTDGKIKLLEILLSVEGISLTACTSKGHFQIWPTLVSGNCKAISLVLKSNIITLGKDENCNDTVIHYLVFNNNPGMAKELKPYISKYDVNAINKYGNSTLHYAFRKNNWEMVKLLLEHCTPSCVPNIYGYTPIYTAYNDVHTDYGQQFEQYIELLLRNGADPQCVVVEKNNKQGTLFDIAKITHSLNRMEAVIAHLVLQEKFGTPITELTYTKINLHSPLRKYCKKCHQLINKNICGSIKLFQILTGNKMKLARYMNKKQLLLKLERLDYKNNLKAYSYYHNILKKSIPKAIQYKKILDEIVGVVSEICDNRFDQNHLVINTIIDYLDEKTVNDLHQLTKVM